MKKLKEKFNSLQKSKKIQLIIAVLLTVAVLIAAPTLAWFSYQRQIATMAKINSPAKLTIKSGHDEDIIQFEMNGINVGSDNSSGSEYFVFCVEGEDIATYNLQIAHTTNIPFIYTLHKAHESASGTVDYEGADGTIYHYALAEQFFDNSTYASRGVYGGYINDSENSNRTIADNNYTEKSYDIADYNVLGDGTHVQRYAEPIYWQTKEAIHSDWVDNNGVQYNEYGTDDPDNRFLNYYILQVSWTAGSFPEGNDKETDLIYITAQVGD
ncbi:hypothetical protein SAMN02910289_00865 [Lachnospiraceae bacterium RM5]|nr:hypothetical protein SAMN02910289_00865 [Lachnospiraceae bacterium RM5]